MFEDFIEKIYPHLLNVLDENRIAIMRKRFFSLVGDVYEDEDLYTERLNAFLEWLLVDARIAGLSRSLLRHVIEAAGASLDNEIREMAESMATSRRSLFILAKKGNEFSILEDIFDKERFYVDRDIRIDRTESRSLVESRVFLYRGHSRIVSTYLPYPKEHKKILLKRLKLYIENGDCRRERFMEYASALLIRSTRYRNIPVIKIARSLDYLISGGEG